jgi:DNA-binding NarL/FixJ family response regulator
MTEKIYIQIGNEKIEAVGDQLDYILETQKQLQAESDKLEADLASKILARQSALAKLAALGLTEEEIAAL